MKAQRLVDYCLGDFKECSIPVCTGKSSYLKNEHTLLLRAEHKRLVLFASYSVACEKSRLSFDQKKVVEAMISQRAKIPPGLNCWLIRGDSAGLSSDPKQGLHISGMRLTSRRDLVLVPTSNRNRFLGPKLDKQMKELRKSWVPWSKKLDKVWWGGALTGDKWEHHEPRILTRRKVLSYFRDHPSDQISLHLTQLPRGTKSVLGIKLEDDFTKESAYRYKCILLLPGNDIASASSWYFAGNSLVLMQEPHIEHILYFEMNPWEHYVPIENNPADILVKLQWAIDNREEANKIILNSHERLRWLCGSEYLWACNEVLHRIAQPPSVPDQ